ncbi:MAG: potassium transporter TrkG, partial [Candidatus Aenigmatarchaeota archaeon]
ISIVFSGLSTGGFSPVKNLQLFGSNALNLIVAVMITGGISFYIHHSIFFKKFSNLKSEELLIFLIIIFLFSILFFIYSGLDYFTSLFHVTSATTATGFSFLDLNNLQQPLKVLLMMLMFIGGSSFSTSGGIKIYRILIFFKSIGYTIRKKLGYEDKLLVEGREVSDNEILLHLINVFLSIILVFICSFIFSLYGHNFLDSVFECVSAFSNAGLSTGIVSIHLNFIEKLLLILLMGIGRVEAIVFFIAIFRVKNK